MSPANCARVSVAAQIPDSVVLRTYFWQAKRKRLFYLFQKYDEDDSGSLEAGCLLTCTALSLREIANLVSISLLLRSRSVAYKFGLRARKQACLLAGEVKVLLSDMGHDYEEEAIQKALSLVAPQVPGKVDAGIQFQEFCEVAFSVSASACMQPPLTSHPSFRVLCPSLSDVTQSHAHIME